MKWLYDFHGGAPHLRKYQIAATWTATVPGVQVRSEGTANQVGVRPGSETQLLDGLGVTTDAAGSRRTAQSVDNDGVAQDPQETVTVAIDPGAVYDAVISGGAGVSTAMTIFKETVGSTTGATITSEIGTVYDDGFVWGFKGANTQVLRKIEAVDGSTSTLEVAFQFDIAINDEFLATTFGPGGVMGMGLTTRLDQIDASSDNQTGRNWRCVELNHKDVAGNGLYESSAHIIMADHVFSGNLTTEAIDDLIAEGVE